MFEDYHIHTDFSADSDEKMENQVKRAIELGLDEICFTDHVDYGIKRDYDDPRGPKYRHVIENGREYDDPCMNVNYPEYFEQLHHLKEVYKDSISIKQGLEFGVQSHTVEEFKQLYAKYQNELDFVLLSMHQIGDLEFWTGDFQRGKTQKEYNDQYYQEILKTMKMFKDYSCLAHLDLIVRYDDCGLYPFEEEKEIITEILKLAIKEGKGIEVNTSSWRYGLTDTQPSRKILNLYRQLGGTIITVGSDAHKVEHLATHIEEVKRILKEEIGFEYYCTFDGMKPIFHKL